MNTLLLFYLYIRPLLTHIHCHNLIFVAPHQKLKIGVAQRNFRTTDLFESCTHLCCPGLADTLAYGLMSLLSYIVFNGSTPMPYLTFFSW